MLNIKYIVTSIFIFISFSLALHGQKQVVPGYQGKRMMVGLHYHFMSSLSGPNAKGINLDGDPRDEGDIPLKPFAMSGRFELNASYVFSRRLTGTLDFGHGQTGLRQRALIQPQSGQEYKAKGIYKAGYSYAAIGIQLQKKKRWGIAPIGPYWGVRYIATKSHQPTLLLFGQGYDEGYEAFKDCECTNTVPVNEATGESVFKSKVYHNLEFQFGIKNIIKQHYFYDFAITTAPPGYNTLDDYSYDNEDSFDIRLKQMFILNIRMGVGMLF